MHMLGHPCITSPYQVLFLLAESMILDSFGHMIPIIMIIIYKVFDSKVTQNVDDPHAGDASALYNVMYVDITVVCCAVLLL